MEIVSVALLVLAGLALLGLVAFMLNRAWGDFPKTSALPGGPPPSTKGGPGSAARPAPPADDDLEPLEPRELPAGAPAGSRIAVEHPLVRRAIEQSMQKGGSPYAGYFIRDGETIYLNLARIADPGQRQRIAAMVREVNGKEAGDSSILDSIRAVQELMRLR
jgi:hypothetical protein